MTNEIKRFALPLNLQLFAEGDPEPTPTPTPEPTPDPTKSFSQEELDRVVADRLARAAKKFADYDELKTKLTTFEQAEEERSKAAMTEQERLAAEKAAAEKKAQDAEERADKALTTANQRLIKAEFRAQARELGVRADALDDAFKLADMSAVTVDDEGNAAGVKGVVEALLTNKPYLAEVPKTVPKTIGNPSNPNPDLTSKTAEQALKDAADKARSSGKIEDVMAYSALKVELGKA